MQLLCSSKIWYISREQTCSGIRSRHGTHQEAELCDCVVRVVDCLPALLAHDADAHICSLDHCHIIGAISDGQHPPGLNNTNWVSARQGESAATREHSLLAFTEGRRIWKPVRALMPACFFICRLYHFSSPLALPSACDISYSIIMRTTAAF